MQRAPSRISAILFLRRGDGDEAYGERSFPYCLHGSSALAARELGACMIRLAVTFGEHFSD